MFLTEIFGGVVGVDNFYQDVVLVNLVGVGEQFNQNREVSLAEGVAVGMHSQLPDAALIFHLVSLLNYILRLFLLEMGDDEGVFEVGRGGLINGGNFIVHGQHLFALAYGGFVVVDELGIDFVPVVFIGLLYFAGDGLFHICQLFDLLGEGLCCFLTGMVAADPFHCHFIPVFLCELIHFSNLCLCVGLDSDKVVLYLGQQLFFFQSLDLKGGEKLANAVVFLLIYASDRFEVVGLVVSEHLALTAG